MKTRIICLAIGILLLCPFASAQWVRTNCPYPCRVDCFAVSGTTLFAGGSGVLLSTDNGTSWTVAGPGLPSTLVHALAVNPKGAGSTNLFAGTYDGVYLSTDNGTSWTEASTGLTNTEVWALAVSPNGAGGTNLFAGTYGGVYLSSNNGTNWTAANAGLPSPYVQHLAVSPNGAGGRNLFAGTYCCGVFLSTNDGTSWTAASSGLADSNVCAFAVIGTDLFAGTYSGGVFLSTNSGTSWTAVNSGLPHDPGGPRSYLPVIDFAVSGRNLFTSNQVGVFVSTNSGTSWTAVMTDPYIWTFAGALAVSGSNLFAATDSALWRRPLSEMITSVEPVRNGLPHEFVLEQNYPNPFNPTTKIQFSIVNPRLPHEAQHGGQGQLTIVKVFDVLGRDVATLVNEVKEPGTHTVQFDGSAFSSGVYFYRLTAGNFTQTKRLMLLK